MEVPTQHISQTTPWDPGGSEDGTIPTDSFSGAGEMKLLSREHEDICEGS